MTVFPDRCRSDQFQVIWISTPPGAGRRQHNRRAVMVAKSCGSALMLLISAEENVIVAAMNGARCVGDLGPPAIVVLMALTGSRRRRHSFAYLSKRIHGCNAWGGRERSDSLPQVPGPLSRSVVGRPPGLWR